MKLSKKQIKYLIDNPPKEIIWNIDIDKYKDRLTKTKKYRLSEYSEYYKKWKNGDLFSRKKYFETGNEFWGSTWAKAVLEKQFNDEMKDIINNAVEDGFTE